MLHVPRQEQRDRRPPMKANLHSAKAVLTPLALVKEIATESRRSTCSGSVSRSIGTLRCDVVHCQLRHLKEVQLHLERTQGHAVGLAGCFPDTPRAPLANVPGCTIETASEDTVHVPSEAMMLASSDDDGSQRLSLVDGPLHVLWKPCREPRVPLSKPLLIAMVRPLRHVEEPTALPRVISPTRR